MPPLQSSGFSPIGQNEDSEFVLIPGYHIVYNKEGSYDDAISLRSMKHIGVHSQRDVIVGGSPLDEVTLEHKDENSETRRSYKPMDLLDIFTNLCVCETNRPKMAPTRSKKTTAAGKRRTVYPIAKYPARLNSPYLVQQRRKSLEEKFTFRPLPEEEHLRKKPRRIQL